MRNKKYYLYLDYEQTRIVIESLVRLKNALLRQGRYTDCVDEPDCKGCQCSGQKIKLHMTIRKGRLFRNRTSGFFSYAYIAVRHRRRRLNLCKGGKPKWRIAKLSR